LSGVGVGGEEGLGGVGLGARQPGRSRGRTLVVFEIRDKGTGLQNDILLQMLADHEPIRIGATA